MNRSLRIAIGLVAGGLLLAPVIASATCRTVDRKRYTIDGGQDTVIKQNAAIGERIKELTAPGDGSLVTRCTGPDVAVHNYFNLAESDVPGVRMTGLEGVGVKILWAPDGGAPQPFPFNTDIDGTGTYEIYNTGTFHIEFYRISGNFTGGLISDGQLSTAAYIGYGGFIGQSVDVRSVPFRLATCAVTTSSINQTVPLGAHTASDFDASGKGPWHSFQLESDNCDLAYFSKAYFTFSGNSPAGHADLFAVDDGPTPVASGVGLKLQADDGSSVIPGTALELTARAAGQVYAFEARYEKTDAAIGGGSANARVMVNVEYD